jgi:AraC-like DNA-binding protein/mannose-6-phosphate isomerase-like protein (cupin superfamily)
VAQQYVIADDVQECLTRYFKQYGKKTRFPEAVAMLRQEGKVYKDLPAEPDRASARLLSDREFMARMGRFALPVPPDILENLSSDRIREGSVIPEGRDVFVIHHFRNTDDYIHRHDYFEMNYVFSGTAVFTFEDVAQTLREGDCCIIAPFSGHGIESEGPDSVLITIFIRMSTFREVFFNLRSRRDVLSFFFRAILSDTSKPNFLLFRTGPSPDTRMVIRFLALESRQHDPYSNICSISLINIFFAGILREESQAVQFTNVPINPAFAPILGYLQTHSQTATLKGMSALFHYSEPHFSALFRRNTGYTFTNLVKRIRMTEAGDYLQSTQFPIARIAEITGYHSADHFARVFREYYKQSPQSYRKQSLERGSDL